MIDDFVQPNNSTFIDLHLYVAINFNMCNHYDLSDLILDDFPKTSFLWPLLILEISIINMIWIDLKIFLKILLSVINFNKFLFLFDRLQRRRSNF